MSVLQSSESERLFEYTCTVCKMVHLQDEPPQRIAQRVADSDAEGNLIGEPEYLPICEECTAVFPNVVEIIRT